MKILLFFKNIFNSVYFKFIGKSNLGKEPKKLDKRSKRTVDSEINKTILKFFLKKKVLFTLLANLICIFLYIYIRKLLNEWYLGFYSILGSGSSTNIYKYIFWYLFYSLSSDTILSSIEFSKMRLSLNWRESIVINSIRKMSPLNFKNVEYASQKISQDSEEFTTLFMNLAIDLTLNILFLVVFMFILFDLINKSIFLIISIVICHLFFSKMLSILMKKLNYYGDLNESYEADLREKTHNLHNRLDGLYNFRKKKIYIIFHNLKENYKKFILQKTKSILTRKNIDNIGTILPYLFIPFFRKDNYGEIMRTINAITMLQFSFLFFVNNFDKFSQCIVGYRRLKSYLMAFYLDTNVIKVYNTEDDAGLGNVPISDSEMHIRIDAFSPDYQDNLDLLRNSMGFRNQESAITSSKGSSVDKYRKINKECVESLLRKDGSNKPLNSFLEYKQGLKLFSGRKIFDEFCLNVSKKEFVCLYGKSGSGKTTFAKIISTVYEAEGYMSFKGKIRVLISANSDYLDGISDYSYGREKMGLSENCYSKGEEHKHIAAALISEQPDWVIWDEFGSGLSSADKEYVFCKLKENLKNSGVILLCQDKFNLCDKFKKLSTKNCAS
ncbi:ATP-binding cassette domain-containing protein [Candidatus Nesciobacter abundans]|uniref:ATP-binding cassette domain-containing protein n=1 Tax=Candidatus Nesciobacter abundans TaxID=2601668 RepID=A0A5C0UGQ2_9PROT|nr:ATP-binding cassette domain-containing protein [Candidatus Nesciobacter abundans]QEK39258.1 ATP-binding cassette domain-containing protein [Candidatus Nesciobacter abundans]